MSLYPGQSILFRLCCPRCGVPLYDYQPANSEFFIINCGNEECEMKGSSVLVERRSGIVLSVREWEWQDATGQRWRQVFEKVSTPVKKEGN